MTFRPPVVTVALALLLSVGSGGGCGAIVAAGRRLERPDRERPGRQNPEPDVARGPVAPLPETAVRTGHPRLYLPERDPFGAGDDQSRQWQKLVQKHADDQLRAPPIAYTRGRVLANSRDAVRRITQLGAAYQMTRDPKYADAARRELLNVCAFPDWQPEDFLATGEMMFAVAVGYDWTYDALPEADRRTIADGLLNLGLKPALADYAKKAGWTVARHNWNMVCNGGTIVAACALLDEAPANAKRALQNALASLRNGLDAYDPQGGTHEGPMYHTYATRYLVYAAAAMESVYGSDAPVEAIDRNWLNAGDYRMQTTGPLPVATGGYKSCNFGDSAEVVGNTAWMFWLAKHTNRPEYAKFEIAADHDEPSAFDLLWYQPGTGAQTPPLAAKFGSVLTLRSAFDDPDATYVALRTGTANDNHTHLDLGTFVLDMSGRRFVSDLGPESYDLPGILNRRKADYLRSSTPGHNTPTVGDASQPGEAYARGELVRQGRTTAAQIDLVQAYPTARSATRTASIDPDGSVLIADAFRFSNSTPLTWNLHTQAKVRQDGNRVTLEIDDRRVEVRVEEPAGARLRVEPDVVSPPAYPLKGFTHLRWTAPASTQTRFSVRFVPVK